MQEQHSAFFSLGKFLRKCFPNEVFTPNHYAGKNHWTCIYFVISSLSLADFLFVIMHDFPNCKIQQKLPRQSNITKLYGLIFFFFAKMSCSLKLLMILEYKEVKQ